jgi:hypothetical protein
MGFVEALGREISVVKQKPPLDGLQADASQALYDNRLERRSLVSGPNAAACGPD